MDNIKRRIIVYRHCDLDGLASAAIVRKKYLKYSNIKFISVNYGQQWKEKDVKDNLVIVVDFSFPNMKELKDKAGELIWIDHHKTAMESQPVIWNCFDTKGLRDIKNAGCVLTWKYFFQDVGIPYIIKLIGDRDIWNFEDKYTRAIYEYIELFIRYPDDKLWESLFSITDDLSDKFKYMYDIGKILLDKKYRQVKKDFEHGIEIILEGHKCWSINSIYNRSDLGEYGYKIKKYPIVMIYHIERDKVICSLRSNTIDVSNIAKKYNGGGHKYAASFTIYLKEFIKLGKDS